MSFKIGSLFSGGLGGLELGLEAAGLGHTAWQCEIDPEARRNLRRHWPGVLQFEDVRDIHSGAYLDSAVAEWFPPASGSEYTDEERTVAGILKKLTKEQANECVRMYDAGLGCGPIAEYFGVSRSAMYVMLRRRTTMRSNLRFGAENHFHRGGATEDDRAQGMVEKAVLRGAVIRPSSCETCGVADYKFKDGSSAIQAHHDDYNKPLDVRWLCQKCHHAWHKANTAIKKEVLVEAPAVDVICGGFP
jgi:transposase-like protein